MARKKFASDSKEYDKMLQAYLEDTLFSCNPGKKKRRGRPRKEIK